MSAPPYGKVLRGNILSIGARGYKFQKGSDGKIENVSKNKVTKVTFSLAYD